MAKTPSKKLLTDNQFHPKELESPSKDSPGIIKTIFSHVCHLHSVLTSWLRNCDKGTKIFKEIHALKLYEYEDSYYPQELHTLSTNLLEVLDNLKHIVEDVSTLKKQLAALSKLQHVDKPLIFTWSAEQISNNINKIHIELEKEYKLKETITENISHCRDEKLIEVYLSAWEFSVYLDIESTSYLFAEVGLTGIT